MNEIIYQGHGWTDMARDRDMILVLVVVYMGLLTIS